MTQDPFQAFGAERTIIKPRLGKSPSQSNPLSAAPLVDHPKTTPRDAENIANLSRRFASQPDTGGNPFINAAKPLVRTLLNLRLLPDLSDLPALSATLKDGLRNAEARLGRHCSASEIMMFRYTLCTFLDEMAANTPWGGSGAWSANGLLLAHFNETWGGEKVFLLIQKMLKNPKEHAGQLALAEWLLSLGFKGKYHVQNQGDHHLAQLQATLSSLPEVQRLSQRERPNTWRSTVQPAKSHWKVLPLWLPFAVAASVCTLVFSAFYFQINASSDPLFDALAGINVPTIQMPVLAAPTPVASNRPTLSQLLTHEIQTGNLTIDESTAKATLTITGDAVFDSGQANVSAQAAKLIHTISRAIDRVSASGIRVVGHTDNVPIRSLQFPSNWALSQARAQSVGALLHKDLPNTPVSTEGAGASKPIAKNQTAEGRAQNRRVEINVLHQAL